MLKYNHMCLCSNITACAYKLDLLDFIFMFFHPQLFQQHVYRDNHRRAQGLSRNTQAAHPRGSINSDAGPA